MGSEERKRKRLERKKKKGKSLKMKMKVEMKVKKEMSRKDTRAEKMSGWKEKYFFGGSGVGPRRHGRWRKMESNVCHYHRWGGTFLTFLFYSRFIMHRAQHSLRLPLIKINNNRKQSWPWMAHDTARS